MERLEGTVRQKIANRIAWALLILAVGAAVWLLVNQRCHAKPQFTDPVALAWLEAATAVTQMDGWRIAEVVEDFHRRAEVAQTRANDAWKTAQAKRVDFLTPSDSMAVRRPDLDINLISLPEECMRWNAHGDSVWVRGIGWIGPKLPLRLVQDTPHDFMGPEFRAVRDSIRIVFGRIDSLKKLVDQLARDAKDQFRGPELWNPPPNLFPIPCPVDTTMNPWPYGLRSDGTVRWRAAR